MAFVYPHSDDPRFVAMRVNGHESVALQIAEEGGLDPDDEAEWEDQPSVNFNSREDARRWIAALIRAARDAELHEPAEERGKRHD